LKGCFEENGVQLVRAAFAASAAGLFKVLTRSLEACSIGVYRFRQQETRGYNARSI